MYNTHGNSLVLGNEGCRRLLFSNDSRQGLKGQSSALLIEDLDSNSWYQISAVAERAEGIFSAPVYAMVQINREPPRILEATAQPVTGSVQSLALLVMLDCSSSPASETCSFLR